jgi:predicted nucleic acid-binding Zn ribbon protein
MYRVEYDEPHRRCPTCGKVVPVYDALCTRCGTELEYPEPNREAQPVAAP